MQHLVNASQAILLYKKSVGQKEELIKNINNRITTAASSGNTWAPLPDFSGIEHFKDEIITLLKTGGFTVDNKIIKWNMEQ